MADKGAYEPDYDPTTQSLDPVLTQATNGPSPAEEAAAVLAGERNLRNRIAQAEASGPTVRQRTQSEIIDLSLLADRLGNPFSTRWIPFEQLREMTTDLMLAFGWWTTISPIIRADWSIQSPDAQLSAAVDEALRPVITQLLMSFSNALWYGHQPIVKQFKLGQLGSTYRDPNAVDPNKDLPTWPSSAQALLWRPPATLNPSHCMPTWNDDGQMTGFKFSNTPIPHFDLISAASAYGYEVIPGHNIDSDYAVWVTNEAELQFGSVFGRSRTQRAYPYWWSYWYRWHMADRAYENQADPAKYVYYPVDFDSFIDPDDPNAEDPKILQARQTAIDIGQQIRSGATIAFPGTFAEGSDGKPTNNRKWEAGYFQSQNNFADLEATFKALDIQKLRAWFTPEQSVIEGTGSRTAGGSGGGTGGARMASQLADVQEQNQQGLVDQYDAYINDQFIPQFIAANFPEKIGTPCRRASRALGSADDSTLSQVLTLVGQVRGEVLPVDIRALLQQLNVPLLTEDAMKAEIKQISELQAIMGPPQAPPEQVGTQGYNAGVVATEKGNQYAQPPLRIVLAESDGFMNTLPDTPHFRDVAVRSALVRLRRLYLDRYEQQYKSFSSFLDSQATLYLDQTAEKKPALDEKQAKASAAAIVGLWASSNAPGTAGAAVLVASEPGVGADTAALIGKIALSGGKVALKGARLDSEDFGAGVMNEWVDERTESNLSSVDQTVTSEVQDWLTTELQSSIDPTTVAAAAREHFSGFPQTHADRVSRTVATDAFNQGTAQALHHAGVAQVMLHDASDGANKMTDAACLKRNGKIVSTEAAMGEHLNHPNCTLYLTPLSTEKLSVKRVDSLPEHLAEADRHVAYDERDETLYLDGQIDADQEKNLVILIGEQLALR